MKQFIRYIGALIIGSLLIVGCGKDIAPDEMAQSLYRFYIQENMTEIEPLKLTEEEAKDIINSSIESFEEELKQSLNSIAEEKKVVINEADIKEAIVARRALEKELSVKTEIISQEKYKAKVKVETTYFNEADIYESAIEALEEEIKNIEAQEQETQDKGTFTEKCIDIYLKQIIKAYQEAQISTESKYIEVQFIKQKNIWQPIDKQVFINQLANLTAGYDVD